MMAWSNFLNIFQLKNVEIIFFYINTLKLCKTTYKNNNLINKNSEDDGSYEIQFF